MATRKAPAKRAPKPAISVLLPSRGRPESLAAAIGSLRDLAVYRPLERIEFLVAADPDDSETQDAAIDLGAELLVTDERYGYSRLHEYVNRLAEKAAANWLLLWNDDARMLTERWDRVVLDPQHADAAVLWPASNNSVHLNVFPIVAARMVRTLGHFSLSPHCDSWVQDVSQAAGLQRRIPVEVLHDRFDLTGGHDDQTRAESIAQYRTNEYHSPDMVTARQQDAARLRAAWAKGATR